jgi:large subunit ribosomal protein L31
VKDKIHPKYTDSKIVCACGNVVQTRSTKPEVRVEICSNCHPFFTGKERAVDATGRVEKFRKRYGLTDPKATA